MTDKSTEWALMWAKVEARRAKEEEEDPSPAAVQRRITEVAKFDRGFLHAMGISLVLILCLCLPAHARKRNKIIAIGAAVGGAIVAGALASSGNQSQPPTTRSVVAHHGMRH